MPWFAALIPALGAAGTAAGGAATAAGATALGTSVGGALAGSSLAAGAGGWLATAANVANVVGTIGSVASSLMSNNANAGAASAQAAAAQRQAKIQESNYRYEARQTLGKQRAMIGASGVSGSSGTPMDVMLESAYNAELNAQRIRYGGKLEASGYRQSASMSKGRNFGALAGGLADAGSLISKFLN